MRAHTGTRKNGRVEKLRYRVAFFSGGRKLQTPTGCWTNKTWRGEESGIFRFTSFFFGGVAVENLRGFSTLSFSPSRKKSISFGGGGWLNRSGVFYFFLFNGKYCKSGKAAIQKGSCGSFCAWEEFCFAPLICVPFWPRTPWTIRQSHRWPQQWCTIQDHLHLLLF